MKNIVLDPTSAAEKAERYYAAHPDSPSALHRPKIFQRSGTWVALYGADIETGTTGFGSTVEAALRTFDVRYFSALRSPKEVSAP